MGNNLKNNNQQIEQSSVLSDESKGSDIQSLNQSSDGSNFVKKGENKPVELTQEWVHQQIEIGKSEVFEDAKKEIDKQVQTDKASLITVFGIFASIISFLTIEFQFLKNLCSFEKILGFTLVLFALLLGFNIVLDYLVKSRFDKNIPKPSIYYIIFISFLLFMGIIITFYGNEEVCKDNMIYQKYSEQFRENFENKTQEIDKHLNNQDNTIRNINSSIDTLKNINR